MSKDIEITVQEGKIVVPKEVISQIRELAKKQKEEREAKKILKKTPQIKEKRSKEDLLLDDLADEFEVIDE